MIIVLAAVSLTEVKGTILPLGSCQMKLTVIFSSNTMHHNSMAYPTATVELPVEEPMYEISGPPK